jgi:hypothetical protein
MALGPDPNRWSTRDRDLSAEEQADGGGLPDPRSTRMGLSSWTIAIIAVLLVVGAWFLL